MSAIIEFMECPECANKPGSPPLCDSCINNRNAIEQLKAELRMSTTNQWRPMSEVPKDGTWILGLPSHREAFRARAVTWGVSASMLSKSCFHDSTGTIWDLVAWMPLPTFPDPAEELAKEYAEKTNPEHYVTMDKLMEESFLAGYKAGKGVKE